MIGINLRRFSCCVKNINIINFDKINNIKNFKSNNKNIQSILNGFDVKQKEIDFNQKEIDFNQKELDYLNQKAAEHVWGHD